MKSAFFLCLLLMRVLNANGQYNPVFTDDLESNTHHWKVNAKKPYLDFSSGMYHIYNDEGKQPVISLVDVAMDGSKAYLMESQIEQSYTPDPDGGWYGLVFGATDEKNGYAFVLSKYANFALIRLTNGKKAEIFTGNCNVADRNGLFYTGNTLKIILGKARWHFFVNDSLLYTSAPLSLNGVKSGFYVSAQSGLKAYDLRISSADHSSGTCPVLFTQDEFNTTINKVSCAAPDDFEELLGEFDDAIDDFEFWDVKDIALPGTYEIYMASGGNSQIYRKGKDFIFGFICADSADIDMGLIFFDQLVSTMSHFIPQCGTVDYKDKFVNLSEVLIESMQWKGEMDDGDAGTLHLLIELDFIKSEGKYYTYMHVNVPT